MSNCQMCVLFHLCISNHCLHTCNNCKWPTYDAGVTSLESVIQHVIMLPRAVADLIVPRTFIELLLLSVHNNCLLPCRDSKLADVLFVWALHDG